MPETGVSQQTRQNNKTHVGVKEWTLVRCHVGREWKDRARGAEGQAGRRGRGNVEADGEAVIALSKNNAIPQA